MTYSGLVLHHSKIGVPSDPAELIARRQFRGDSAPRLQTSNWDRAHPLNEILEPIGIGRFLKDFYGKTYSHVPAQDARRLESFFSYAVLGSQLPHTPTERISLFRHGKPVAAQEIWPGPEVDATKFNRFISGPGTSAKISGWEVRDPSLSRLATEIQDWCGQRAHINSYLTLRGAKTLPWHWDQYDVFILQIEGKKKWELFAPLIRHPLRSHDYWHWPEFNPRTSTKLGSVSLNKGDVLYLPGGFPHVVSPVGRADSLHLTIGLHPIRRIDVISKVAQRFVAEIGRDVDGRLPVLGASQTTLGASERRRILRLLTKTFSRVVEADLDLAFAETVRVDGCDLSASQKTWSSLVSSRDVPAGTELKWTGRYFVVDSFAGHLRLRTRDESFLLKAHARTCLKRLQSGKTMKVGALPGVKSPREARELVALLVSHGLVAAA